MFVTNNRKLALSQVTCCFFCFQSCSHPIKSQLQNSLCILPFLIANHLSCDFKLSNFLLIPACFKCLPFNPVMASLKPCHFEPKYTQNQYETAAKINVPWSLWKWGQFFVILLPCEFSLFHKKLCSSLNLWWSDTISLNKWLRNPLHVELRLHTLRAPSHWDTFHTNLVCFSSFVNCKTWYKQKHTTFD